MSSRLASRRFVIVPQQNWGRWNAYTRAVAPRGRGVAVAVLIACAARLDAQAPSSGSARNVAARERTVTGGDSTYLSSALRLGLRARVAESLRDPFSLQQFRILGINALIQADTIERGRACGELNATNGYGGFVGRSYFVVLLKGPTTSARSAGVVVTISSQEDNDFLSACNDLGPKDSAPWVASVSSKTVFRAGCLASRRIATNDRRYFWLLAEALRDSFAPSKAPLCGP